LLLIFYCRGGGEDFIERTFALHTHIIRIPVGFASGLVPLIKVAHNFPIWAMHDLL
tara:strand:- start:70 stop:237 length:168 start_codon:yes stop_codon:yes gene_type:complete